MSLDKEHGGPGEVQEGYPAAAGQQLEALKQEPLIRLSKYFRCKN